MQDKPKKIVSQSYFIIYIVYVAEISEWLKHQQ